jgi:hypothetical protein
VPAYEGEDRTDADVDEEGGAPGRVAAGFIRPAATASAR